MTIPLARIRDAALQLPDTEERASEGGSTFLVAGAEFVRFVDGGDGDGAAVARVRTAGADEQAMLIDTDPARYVRADGAEWVGMRLGDEVDWTLVEERIARSWELAAPRALLEAGGR